MIKNNQEKKEKRKAKTIFFERKNDYKNKGITLIALVITIIVLLILAGVTITTLIGENGILTKASEAKDNTVIAQDEEMIGLEILREL